MSTSLLNYTTGRVIFLAQSLNDPIPSNEISQSSNTLNFKWLYFQTLVLYLSL